MGNSIFEVIVSNIVNYKVEVLSNQLQALKEIKTKINNGEKIQNGDVERARNAHRLIYEWLEDYGRALGLEWLKMYDLFEKASAVWQWSDEIMTAYNEQYR